MKQNKWNGMKNIKSASQKVRFSIVLKPFVSLVIYVHALACYIKITFHFEKKYINLKYRTALQPSLIKRGGGCLQVRMCLRVFFFGGHLLYFVFYILHLPLVESSRYI